MCIDYRVDDLLDKLAKAKVFNRIDLKLGYYQICIVEEDIEKTTCRTCYGSYELR